MDPDGIMLSKIKSEKDKYCIILLRGGIEKTKLNKQNKLTHRYIKIDNCQRVGWWGMDKKAKGIRRYNVNSHGDVKDNVRTVDITITSYLDRWIVDFLW